jgi:hypothetical protein
MKNENQNIIFHPKTLEKKIQLISKKKTIKLGTEIKNTENEYYLYLTAMETKTQRG